MKDAIRVHEIDVRVDIGIKGHKEKRRVETVQIGRVQDLFNFRDNIWLLQFVKVFSDYL